MTKSANDVISLLGDGTQYQKACVETFMAGGEECLRAKFNEGGYLEHIDKFNVVLDLSAYMLGYSNMLMQATFQCLAEIGATPLYADTDSVAFSATPEQWRQYSDRFVPIENRWHGA